MSKVYLPEEKPNDGHIGERYHYKKRQVPTPRPRGSWVWTLMLLLSGLTFATLAATKPLWHAQSKGQPMLSLEKPQFAPAPPISEWEIFSEEEHAMLRALGEISRRVTQIKLPTIRIKTPDFNVTIEPPPRLCEGEGEDGEVEQEGDGWRHIDCGAERYIICGEGESAVRTPDFDLQFNKVSVHPTTKLPLFIASYFDIDGKPRFTYQVFHGCEPLTDILEEEPDALSVWQGGKIGFEIGEYMGGRYYFDGEIGPACKLRIIKDGGTEPIYECDPEDGSGEFVMIGNKKGPSCTQHVRELQIGKNLSYICSYQHREMLVWGSDHTQGPLVEDVEPPLMWHDGLPIYEVEMPERGDGFYDDKRLAWGNRLSHGFFHGIRNGSVDLVPFQGHATIMLKATRLDDGSGGFRTVLYSDRIDRFFEP